MGIIRNGAAVAVLVVGASLGGMQLGAADEANYGAVADAPPPAHTVDVTDHLFGLTLPDPYRWMEGSNNAGFDAWLKMQGEYTRAKLDALSALAGWRERLRQANGAAVFNVGFQRAGGKVFFLRMADKGNPVLMVREADGRQRPLLDPASLDGGQNKSAIRSFAPSPDGRLVAIDIGLGEGQEISRIKVLDTQTLQWLPDIVGPVWGEFTANWLPDGRGFAYTELAPPGERPNGDFTQNMRVRLHRLGTPAANDPILLRAGNGKLALPKIASSEFPFLILSSASRWALAGIGGAHLETRLCIALRVDAIRSGAKWRCIADYADGVQKFALRGDTLYLLAVKGNPNGRVLALDLSQPGASLKNARVLVPASDDVVLTDIAAADDALYIKRMRNGIDDVVQADCATGQRKAIRMPFAGSVDFHADPAASGIVFKVRGWTRPGVGYLWHNGTLSDVGLRDGSRGDYGMLTSVETEAASRDGTRVPLSIIQRKDVRLDGRQRALVEGYGGYGISLQPSFFPGTLEWVKAGEVYAACHVRGGGEKGDAWHRAGQGANKYKGVEDFIACADELARRGYTTPARTALFAGSMGGVLVGGAIAAYPDKFGAALVQSGILNPARLLAGENGANQIAELGDPRTETGLKAIVAMDPYQNIRPTTKYPAVLLLAGFQDDRVPPWHTGKLAAKLQAASSSGKPVWIRTDSAGGHFAFSLGGIAAEQADEYSFLDAVLPGR